jgi:predicted signal transduction protein with EAL and GGDEF domain
LSEPFEIEGHQIFIGSSIGVALAPEGGSSISLVKNVDMALYHAKNAGRGCLRFFGPEMETQLRVRRQLENDLRIALANDQFEIFYQPLISTRGNVITGLEALLRWNHPQRGIVSPDEFISVAEEVGLIPRIGAWVLKQACIDANDWPEQMRVAVNLSPYQFRSGTLLLDFTAALGASGLPAHRLELEVTESVMMENTEETVDVLRKLRELGVRISLDDFGTGYSGLSHLRAFPFDKIKIDKRFVQEMCSSTDSAAIVRAVIRLGASLAIETTAEGVETEEQLARVRVEGCTEVQGFYFAWPQLLRELPSLFVLSKEHLPAQLAG